jgi:hypothetical protein
MKHVKLFEDFYFPEQGMGSGPAQLLVSGDWTGITKDGAPETFIAPATFFVEYLPAGSPIPSGYKDQSEDPIADLEYISEEAFGGDQNGVNVAPQSPQYMKGDNSQYAQDVKQGVLRLFVDPAISPAEIESYLKSECDRIWSTASDKEYYMVDDYDGGSFTPNYLALAMKDRPFKRKVIFTTA